MPGKQIDEENASKVAEELIPGKYPYTNVIFDEAELRTNDTHQVHRFAEYSILAKWPECIASKTLCEVYIDAQSAEIISYHGL